VSGLRRRSPLLVTRRNCPTFVFLGTWPDPRGGASVAVMLFGERIELIDGPRLDRATAWASLRLQRSDRELRMSLAGRGTA
jgi:hypothetical protein